MAFAGYTPRYTPNVPLTVFGTRQTEEKLCSALFSVMTFRKNFVALSDTQSDRVYAGYTPGTFSFRTREAHDPME